MKIRYAKKDRQRLPQFQIETAVVEEDGTLFVRKTALTPQARAHITNIVNNYELLRNKLPDMPVVKPLRVQEDCVLFPYIDGTSYTERLLGALDAKDHQAFLAYLVDFQNALRTFGAATAQDCSLDAFESFFGLSTNLENVECFAVADFDLTFDNVFIDGQGDHHVNKYEWVFPFCLPMDYLLFRGLRLFYQQHKDKLGQYFKLAELLDYVGILKEQRRIYEQMDEAFLCYICGQEDGISSLYAKSASMLQVGKEEHCHTSDNQNGQQLVWKADHHILKADGSIHEKDKQIQALTRDIVALSQTMEENALVLRRKDEVIGDLQRQLALLQASRAYRLTLWLLGPVRLLRGMVRALRGCAPVRLLRLLRLNNFRRAWLYARRNGSRGLLAKLREKLLPMFEAQHIQPEGMALVLETDMVSYSKHVPCLLNVPFEGSFRFPVNGLCRISILTATFQKKAGAVRLTLFTEGRQAIRSCVVKGENIGDCEYTDFIFTPVEDSIGKVFYFQLQSIARPHAAIWCNAEVALLAVVPGRGGSINCRIYSYLKKESEYLLWIDKNEPVESKLSEQSMTQFPETRISILVPLYNTPTQFLQELLDTVVAQTYTNWELCLADGGEALPANERLIAEYSSQHANIKYKKLPKNLGIVGNTNAAAELVTGQWIALLDHDDTLAPFALYEVMRAIVENKNADFIYSDEDKLTEDGTRRFDPFFKPDFSPDTLRSYNYIAHLTVLRRELFESIGQFREGYDGSQDLDLYLRATERARQIIHIPKVLYHWRMSAASTAQNPEAKLYAYESAKHALADHLQRVGLEGKVYDGLFYGSYRIQYALMGNPLVSIIIPNKDNANDLKRCVHSVLKSTYRNIEVVIAENNSTNPDTFALYEELIKDTRVNVVRWEHPFNFSGINNFAVKHTHGTQLLFLNNDIKVTNADWIEQMLYYSQRPDVGAVGAKLYYPDGTIQHGGVILGIGGVAGHAHKYYAGNDGGYFGRLKVVQNLSAVTAACLMMRRDVYERIGGFDETLAVAFNDVDLCLRIRQAGYLIVWTPYSQLTHYESKTRGYEDTDAKVQRFNAEIERIRSKWGTSLVDPYYSPNLSQKSEDYSLNV